VRRLGGGTLLLAVTALLVAVAAGWGAGQRLDARVERAVHRGVLAHRWLASSARALTHLGDPVVVTILTVVLAVVLVRQRRRRAALFVLVVRAVSALADAALKALIDRPRPILTHPLATAAGSSFPSGHAFGSAALWASFALVLGAAVPVWARVAVATAVPVVVATTRVAHGVHFVTDVVAGLLLGWTSALVIAAIMGDLSAESAGTSPDS